MLENTTATSSLIGHSLSARADFDAVLAALALTQELSPTDAIAVLHNLRAVGASAPAALALVSERLDAHTPSAEALEGDELTRSFTVQIAQHYLDDARASVIEAAEAIDHAMNALSSLLEAPPVARQRDAD